MSSTVSGVSRIERTIMRQFGPASLRVIGPERDAAAHRRPSVVRALVRVLDARLDAGLDLQTRGLGRVADQGLVVVTTDTARP